MTGKYIREYLSFSSTKYVKILEQALGKIHETNFENYKFRMYWNFILEHAISHAISWDNTNPFKHDYN